MCFNEMVKEESLSHVCVPHDSPQRDPLTNIRGTWIREPLRWPRLRLFPLTPAGNGAQSEGDRSPARLEEAKPREEVAPTTEKQEVESGTVHTQSVPPHL